MPDAATATAAAGVREIRHANGTTIRTNSAAVAGHGATPPATLTAPREIPSIDFADVTLEKFQEYQVSSRTPPTAAPFWYPQRPIAGSPCASTRLSAALATRVPLPYAVCLSAWRVWNHLRKSTRQWCSEGRPRHGRPRSGHWSSSRRSTARSKSRFRSAPPRCLAPSFGSPASVPVLPRATPSAYSCSSVSQYGVLPRAAPSSGTAPPALAQHPG